MKILKTLKTFVIALRGSSGMLIMAAMSLGALAQPDPSYQVVGRGPFWRDWSRTVQQTDPISGLTRAVVQQYVELEDGACYQDPKSGEWVESQSLIELGDGGTAVAIRGQTKAIFASNLHGSVAIDLLSRQGMRFQLQPIGLAYFDGASGKRVTLTVVQDSTGVLYPPNQIVYPDAFSGGGVKADYRVTYAKNGL